MVFSFVIVMFLTQTLDLMPVRRTQPVPRGISSKQADARQQDSIVKEKVVEKVQ